MGGVGSGNVALVSSDHDARPAPLIQPPRLQTDQERSATRLELFFDLAYVLVIAELAAVLAHDLTWSGAAVFVGLFTVTWWSWVTTTLYANRFDTNDVIYRLAKLGGAVAVVGMAASAGEALSARATAFALSYLATRVLLLGLYARAYRHVEQARPTVVIYLCGTGAGAALWAVALAVPGHGRYLLWAAGVLVEALAPVLATRFGGGVPLHLAHLPERFGLFVMLVLGESIASMVAGLHEGHWQPAAVGMAAVGFVAIAAAWWNYFDLGGAAGKRWLEVDGGDQESWAADAYVYGHLPVTLGLAGFAVGVEQFIAHPADGLTTGARWTMIAGVLLFFAGTAAVIGGTSGRWRTAWPWPVAVLPAVVAVGLWSRLPPVVTMGLTGGILVITVLAGIRQQHQGQLATAET